MRIALRPEGFYAYVLRHPETMTPFYVGKGKGMRYSVHLRRRGPNRILSNTIVGLRAAGLEPLVEIIPASSECAAFEYEKSLILIFGRRDLGLGPLLNYTDGGDGESGRKHKHSDETKRRISEALKGRTFSPETRELKRQIALANGQAKHLAAYRNVPRVLTDAGRKAMSERAKAQAAAGHQALMTERAAASNRGRKHTPEQCRRRSERSRGRVWSDEAKARVTQMRNSPEYRKMQSDAQLKRYRGE